MDSNFANPSTIKVFIDYSILPLLRMGGVEFYKVRMPKRKRFNLMIAFGEEE